VGDAAHASSPMMGQGGCMAMEDACVLAEALCRGATLAEALATYELRRRPRVSWIHRESQAIAHGFRLPARGRNDAMRQLGAQRSARTLCGIWAIRCPNPVPHPFPKRRRWCRPTQGLPARIPTDRRLDPPPPEGMAADGATEPSRMTSLSAYCCPLSRHSVR